MKPRQRIKRVYIQPPRDSDLCNPKGAECIYLKPHSHYPCTLFDCDCAHDEENDYWFRHTTCHFTKGGGYERL